MYVFSINDNKAFLLLLKQMPRLSARVPTNISFLSERSTGGQQIAGQGQLVTERIIKDEQN